MIQVCWLSECILVKLKKRKFQNLNMVLSWAAIAAALVGMPDASFDFSFTIYGSGSGSGSGSQP